MLPSNTCVWFCSELFYVLLLGWERQGQTLMRILYTEDYEGWGAESAAMVKQRIKRVMEKMQDDE